MQQGMRRFRITGFCELCLLRLSEDWDRRESPVLEAVLQVSGMAYLGEGLYLDIKDTV